MWDLEGEPLEQIPSESNRIFGVCRSKEPPNVLRQRVTWSLKACRSFMTLHHVAKRSDPFFLPQHKN